MSIKIKSGTTVENLTFKPMLVKGTTQCDYVPYNLSKEGLRKSINDLSAELSEITTDNTDLSDTVPYNLIPFPYYQSSYQSEGITWTVDEDGVITANGTATGYSVFDVYYLEGTSEALVIGDNYYLTGCPDGGGESTYVMQLLTLNHSEGATSVVDQFFTTDSSGVLVKLTQEYDQLGLQIVITSGCTVNNIKFKPMLVKGDTAKEYHRGFNNVYQLSKKIDYTNIAYCTCSTAGATAEKIINIVGNPDWELAEGSIIVVKFTNTNTASNVTLNVNGTGAKSIYYQQSVYTYDWNHITGFANRSIMYVYDGTYWVWISSSSDNDTYDRTKYLKNIKCGSTAIVGGNIIVGKDGLYSHLKLGNAFDITYPILYASSGIAASGTGTNNFLALPFTLTTTQSITLTAFKPVFIKGSLSGTIFTPVSTTPLTQTVPTSADGYEYILLGMAFSTTGVYLTIDHPIYEYYNGSFQLYVPERSGTMISNEDDLMLNTVEGYSVDALVIKEINSKIKGIEFQIVDGKLQYRYDTEVWG